MKFVDLVQINQARRERRQVVTVTDLTDGIQSLFLDLEAKKFRSGLGISQSSIDASAKSPNPDAERRFVNVYQPPPRIVAIGAVHISQALVELARVAAFDVLVIDPRTAFATAERFGDVEIIADWPEHALAERPLDRFTAVVALSHDPKIDDFAIASGLRESCFYVGALGSRKTHEKRLQRLALEGLHKADLNRISAPIGLDIGAKSPAEIAVAVLADVIKAWRRPLEDSVG